MKPSTPNLAFGLFLMSTAFMATPPLWAEESAAEIQAELSFETGGESLLIEVREVQRTFTGSAESPDFQDDSPKFRTWRIYGDGRFEVSPTRWLRQVEVFLGAEALDQLLKSLDGHFDLPRLQNIAPPPETAPFAAVHLKRYIGPGVAIDYLDAVATADLEPIFRELRAIERWLSRRDHIMIWVSGPSFPAICEEAQRAEHSLAPDPLWCADLERQEIDFEGREDIRERLRERLRTLPRGLQEQTGDSDSAG